MGRIAAGRHGPPVRYPTRPSPSRNRPRSYFTPAVFGVCHSRLGKQGIGQIRVRLKADSGEIISGRAPIGTDKTDRTLRFPGFVSFFSNFAPDLSYSVYEALVANNVDKVAELVDYFSPFFREPDIVKGLPSGSNFLTKVTANHGPHTGFTGGNPMQFAVFKAVMDIIGLRGGEVRLPLVGLDEDEKAELKDILKNIVKLI